MDAPGIREELRDMARRLGTVGYYVMLPNLYYRSGVEELGSVVGEANIATRQKALQLMTTINIPMVMQRRRCAVGLRRQGRGRFGRPDGMRRLLHERAVRRERRRAA